MQKDVSIILVSYNTKDLTRDCIKSIYEKTTDLNFDVWVVDNDSKDGSAEMIKTEFPEVNLIESGVNLGFGGANNLAIEASDANYILLLNTDTILVNNAVKIMHEFMEKTPAAGVCGGNLYDAEMSHVLSYGHMPTLQSKIVKTFKLGFLFPKIRQSMLDNGHNETNSRKKVDYITGADLMIRKRALEEVGSFDKDFFLYFEETELQYRISKQGYEIYIIPESQIIHLEGKSSSNRIKRREYFLKSEYLFFKKCYGLTPYHLMTLLFPISHIARLFVHPKMIWGVWKYIFSNGGGIRE